MVTKVTTYRVEVNERSKKGLPQRDAASIWV